MASKLRLTNVIRTKLPSMLKNKIGLKPYAERVPEKCSAKRFCLMHSRRACSIGMLLEQFVALC